MHKAFVAFYDRWVLSHPLITLLLVACLVAGLATQLGNLKLDASADSLVLEGDEDLEFFRENTARYPQYCIKKKASPLIPGKIQLLTKNSRKDLP